MQISVADYYSALDSAYWEGFRAGFRKSTDPTETSDDE